MRLAKLSLAAIVALGMNAFADVENVKFGGDARLYYDTTDEKDGDLFDKDNARGQAGVDLDMSADVGDGAKFKAGIVALGTLGLENNLVSAIWAEPSPSGKLSGWWIDELWLAKSLGNTTVKVGRQELDTPLAFSEKWNIAENTFDAAVVLNNDLPQTTLVAAYVGRGNGTHTGGVVQLSDDAGTGTYSTYGSAIVDMVDAATAPGTANKLGIKAKGAYAAAAITKLIPYTTAQVWYYNVQSIADAWWLQADVDLNEVLPNLNFGAQYAVISLDDIDTINSKLNANFDDSMAWAVKIGYTYSGFKLKGAYSNVDEDGLVKVANTATGLGNSQSKLYTEAWWNYGYVSAPGAETIHLDATYNVEGLAEFGAYFTQVKDARRKLTDVNDKNDMTEFTLTASKSFGSLDATLAYIYTDADDQNVDETTQKADSYNTIQLYLTYNF